MANTQGDCAIMAWISCEGIFAKLLKAIWLFNFTQHTKVLSRSVGEILKQYYPNQGMESTAQFCLMMDSFFDCLNVCSFTEHKTSHKPNVAPYKNCEDPRLNWLVDNFLVYLRNWKLYAKHMKDF